MMHTAYPNLHPLPFRIKNFLTSFESQLLHLLCFSKRFHYVDLSVNKPDQMKIKIILPALTRQGALRNPGPRTGTLNCNETNESTLLVGIKVEFSEVF